MNNLLWSFVKDHCRMMHLLGKSLFLFCTVFTMFCNKRIIFALLSVAMPLNWKIKEIHQMLTYYLRDL